MGRDGTRRDALTMPFLIMIRRFNVKTIFIILGHIATVVFIVWTLKMLLKNLLKIFIKEED